jgi:hypothetical protein
VVVTQNPLYGAAMVKKKYSSMRSSCMLLLLLLLRSSHSWLTHELHVIIWLSATTSLAPLTSRPALARHESNCKICASSRYVSILLSLARKYLQYDSDSLRYRPCDHTLTFPTVSIERDTNELQFYLQVLTPVIFEAGGLLLDQPGSDSCA